MKCLKCGIENPEDSKFCIKCGTKLNNTQDTTKEDTVACSKCGVLNDKSDNFCTNCGEALKENLTNKTNNPIICPYCGSKLDSGVSKCKYCGEWVTKPIVTGNMNLQNLDAKTSILGAYFLTLISIILTLILYNTPYLSLSGILTLDIIWILICIGIAVIILKKFENHKVDLFGIQNVKIHAIIIIVINIILFIAWIGAYTWNPFL